MEGMPGIQTRYRLRVKQRLAVVEYAKEHCIKPASRTLGLTRVTVRQWWRNWQRAGLQGLIPQYPARRRRRISERVVALITQARLEHRFGANRAQIWLARVHEVRVATETIQRVFRDISVPHLVKTRRRGPKQLKLFEKERPGDSVQIDVKVVVRGRSKWFQYTAIDDCTRVRILRLYRRQNHHSSLAFLRELTTAFPFQIRKIQVDNELHAESRDNTSHEPIGQSVKTGRRLVLPSVFRHVGTPVDHSDTRSAAMRPPLSCTQRGGPGGRFEHYLRGRMRLDGSSRRDPSAWSRRFREATIVDAGLDDRVRHAGHLRGAGRVCLALAIGILWIGAHIVVVFPAK